MSKICCTNGFRGPVHLLLPLWGDYFTPGILIATWVASSLLIHMQVGWAGDWGCLTAALLDESGILLLGCFGDPKNWAETKGKFECVKCHSRISWESQKCWIQAAKITSHGVNHFPQLRSDLRWSALGRFTWESQPKKRSMAKVTALIQCTAKHAVGSLQALPGP